MAVITLEVPSRAQMGYGLGKAIQYGVEYEVINDKTVELSCGDITKLETMIVAFQGKVLDAVTQKNVRVELPRHG